MALMIPENVEQFATDGERQFYRFLEGVAKPDSTHIAWYTPDIHGNEPDFLLFSTHAGMIVFEVKDWNLDQILEANPHQFSISVGSKTERRKNPLQQARDYQYNLMDRIKEDGQLICRDAVHLGKPKIPLSHGVVFTNINKHDYVQKGFDSIIGTDKAFFWDDLYPESDICRDPSGACFQKALLEKFSPRFPFKIKGSELDHLKQLVFPTVKIELPERRTNGNYIQRISRLKGLDHHQETIARKFDGGHRIISGPSGCGKTLVLIHKAAFLKQYNPDIKNILFICYNITLVNYIKRLLANKQVPLGENGVSVMHFFELCSEIIDQEVTYEKEDAEYYELVVQEALEKLEDHPLLYDAILVDEGQDFTDDMYRVIVALLNKKTNNLTIALDENQNIYERKSTWKDVGIQARGRMHRISYAYRNTREISEFANRFIRQKTGPDLDKDLKRKELFSDFFDFSGPKPKIKKFQDIESILEYVGDKILEIVKRDECPYSEIAVLYSKQHLKDRREEPLPVAIQKALETKGILSHWVSENYRSKSTYDITTNRVTVSTIHSVKGLDYACVFLLGPDYLETKSWSQSQIEKLTYVAITRARYQLFIVCINQSPLIKKLQAAL
ncbi:MAG: 3'-5' exonuclease [Planctomycetota bacterium]|jgi:superfamily I DNA and RNA helicase